MGIKATATVTIQPGGAAEGCLSAEAYAKFKASMITPLTVIDCVEWSREFDVPFYNQCWGPAASQDAGSDAAEDASTDAGPDAGPDAGTDTGTGAPAALGAARVRAVSEGQREQQARLGAAGLQAQAEQEGGRPESRALVAWTAAA